MATYKLYVKTHNITGLKYLGYTTKNDVHKYLGSGKYWLRHLSKYGKDYNTQILIETTSTEILRLMGGFYSSRWNIVKSKDWANLKQEVGIEGGCYSEESKIKQSNTQKSRMTEQKRLKISNALKGNIPWNKGKKGAQEVTLEQREKLSNALKGKPWSEARRLAEIKSKSQREPKVIPNTVREKISNTLKGRKIPADVIQKRNATRRANGWKKNNRL